MRKDQFVTNDHAERFEVERLIYRFFLSLDERRYGDVAVLMAPDGVWHRQGRELRGPGDVMEALKLRPGGATTRHLITNVIVDITDVGQAEATFYLAVFFYGADVPPKLPVPIELPRHVSIFSARFTRANADWRVSHMSEVPTFAK